MWPAAAIALAMTLPVHSAMESQVTVYRNTSERAKPHDPNNAVRRRRSWLVIGWVFAALPQPFAISALPGSAKRFHSE